MDFDELQPTGYFSEFSWHSFEDGDPPYTSVYWGDIAQAIAAPGEAQERSDAEAGRDEED